MKHQFGVRSELLADNVKEAADVTAIEGLPCFYCEPNASGLLRDEPTDYNYRSRDPLASCT
jgi:hypothetical protein